jgi:hypothetical protein
VAGGSAGQEPGGAVGMYLGAVVLANVLFGVWGFAVEPWVSMVLIGST